jgi:hypothetical protein
MILPPKDLAKAHGIVCVGFSAFGDNNESLLKLTSVKVGDSIFGFI